MCPSDWLHKWKKNAQVDNAKYINPEMPIHHWIDSSDNYSKTSRSLWEYHRDEPVLTDDCAIDDFMGNNTSGMFIFKEKTTGQKDDNDTENVEIMAPLKFLCNFWRTLEMQLINCEITLILTWSANCFISSHTGANQVTTFSITDAKL